MGNPVLEKLLSKRLKVKGGGNWRCWCWCWCWCWCCCYECCCFSRNWLREKLPHASLKLVECISPFFSKRTCRIMSPSQLFINKIQTFLFFRYSDISIQTHWFLALKFTSFMHRNPNLLIRDFNSIVHGIPVSLQKKKNKICLLLHTMHSDFSFASFPANGIWRVHTWQFYHSLCTWNSPRSCTAILLSL